MSIAVLFMTVTQKNKLYASFSHLRQYDIAMKMSKIMQEAATYVDSIAEKAQLILYYSIFIKFMCRQS